MLNTALGGCSKPKDCIHGSEPANKDHTWASVVGSVRLVTKRRFVRDTEIPGGVKNSMRLLRNRILFFILGMASAQATPNRAIELDGTNDHIALSGLPDLSIDSVRTVEGWVNPISCGDGQAYRVIYSDGSNMLYCEQGRLRFQSTVNNYNTISTDDAILTHGHWHHVALTFEDEQFDGSAAVRARLYVNGHLMPTYGPRALQADENSALLRIPASPGSVAIGRKGTSTYYWKGAMDEVRLWSTTRTAEEILENRDLQLNGDQHPGLLAVYTGDQISGTTVINTTGNSDRDATLVGFDATPHEPVTPVAHTWRESKVVLPGEFATQNGELGRPSERTADIYRRCAPACRTANDANTRSGSAWIYAHDGRDHGHWLVPPAGLNESRFDRRSHIW